MEEYVYKKVKSIVFGLFSPKEIKKMASVKIVTPELYDREGYPVDGGLMDIRLGVIDPGLRCKTCGSKLKECVGHFGYVELARPITHIKYVNIILDILRSTCRDCSRILLDDNKRQSHTKNLERIERTKSVDAKRKKQKEITASLKNVKKCPHCKAKQTSVKLEKPSTFTEADKRLSQIEVRARLEKISNEDLWVLALNPNFSRPEWMVLTVMLIPPVTMRPSITLESGDRSEDDLTHKLGDIVRINQRLFENINAGAPEIIIEDLWDLLQYHVTTFFDNDIAQVPPARHRSGQPLKTITERIKSKEGRFRHNLAGKRVNFSARTVISPDPRIRLDEVGVPSIIAKELTVPETATEWNLEWLKEFVKRGPSVYPGANYVIRPDGKKKKITEETQEQLLQELGPGFVVERHLMDNDIAIFNRQPSLHRMSIMCHRIRVLPGKSFRLNPSVCTPYNADFDGDEMNLHIPQNTEARAEAEILMEVQTQIITPKSGLNIVACIEDSVTGNYLLTTTDKTYKKEEIVDIILSIGVEDIGGLKENMTGREVFSLLLPKDFNFIGKTESGEDVVIIKGKLEKGFIDVKSIGEGSGDIIRNLYKQYGSAKALDTLGKIAKLGIEILLRRGFTTGVSDSDLSKKTMLEIEGMIKEAEAKVEKLIQGLVKGELEAFPGKTIEETLELKILEVLNKVRNNLGEVVINNSRDDNHTMIMAKAGATGKLLNLTQMSACVGQQSLRGKRIEKGYKGRTLTLFKKGDLSPIARGFVSRGFKRGLTPVEFFFSAMTGRDSLMDTALRTPKSGYLYRRLANALQDLKIEYDNTVRDANENIVQFQYGDDGLDVSKSDSGTINIKKIVREVKEGIYE